MDRTVHEPSRRRLAVIVNNRSGRAEAGLPLALAELEAAGLPVRVVHADGPEALAEAIAAAGEAGEEAVIGGGDGTVNAALPTLLKSGRPFGILPLGTANDFARTLGVPFDLAAAARVIAQGRTHPIDVGTANGRPFLNVASVGLPVEVALRHGGERKKRFGVFNYPLVWYEAWRASRPFRARIYCDGVRYRRRCILLAVGNGRHYGGGMTVDADARIDDGLLDVACVTATGPLGLLGLLPAFRFGTVGRRRGNLALRGRKVRIETGRPRQINLDGELGERTPAVFEVLAGALRVFAPEGGPGLASEDTAEAA